MKRSHWGIKIGAVPYIAFIFFKFNTIMTRLLCTDLKHMNKMLVHLFAVSLSAVDKLFNHGVVVKVI